MQQRRYCVIRDDDTQDEYAWHYTLERATETAALLAGSEGVPFRVDLNVVEITRDGVECIDSTPDLFWTS